MKCIRSEEKPQTWVQRLAQAVKRGWARVITLSRAAWDTTLEMFKW